MNIQSTLRKVYDKIKYIQIEEGDLTADNFGEMELAKLEPTEAVN